MAGYGKTEKLIKIFISLKRRTTQIEVWKLTRISQQWIKTNQSSALNRAKTKLKTQKIKWEIERRTRYEQRE